MTISSNTVLVDHFNTQFNAGAIIQVKVAAPNSSGSMAGKAECCNDVPMVKVRHSLRPSF